MATTRWLARGRMDRAIVDESDYALGAKRITKLVGVDSEIRQGVAADCRHNPVGVLRDHLNVTVKQHPVARLRCVAVAQLMPPLMRLGVLADGDNPE